MRRRCREAWPDVRRQAGFGPMHACGADSRCEVRVSGNQQQETTPARGCRQGSRHTTTISGAEMPEDDTRPTRQSLRDLDRIRRTHRVGEEKQRRNRRRPGVAIEPRCLRG